MKKILLVDDEPIFVESMKEVLMAKNYEVFTANNGEEGLEQVKNCRPDLIALDVAMPRMNGYEFIRAFNANTMLDHQAEIPVFIVTARGEMEEVFKTQGVKEYLVKPLEFLSFVQKVESYIGTNG